AQAWAFEGILSGDRREMPGSVVDRAGSLPEMERFSAQHYKELKRRHIFRLLFTYLAPLVLLSIYFFYQYDQMVSESRRLHLRAIAESQANTLDLFLSERIVNLANLIDDPKLQIPPSQTVLQSYLDKLQRDSEAFVDIGFFDPAGVQTQYAGPFRALESRAYGEEAWWLELAADSDRVVITDIYLGFRQRPHFTIAVSRIIDSVYVVMRATLDPAKILDYLRSLEGSQEVYTSIVNSAGYYQLVTEHIGTPLESSSLVPPRVPRIGAAEVRLEGNKITYAYFWLRTAEWALIVQDASGQDNSLLSGYRSRILLISALTLLAGFVMVLYRSRKLVEMQRDSDRTRAQLEHAAKLATVGELAAGIAHEINNPLAAINEEAGLVKDLMDPELGEPTSPAELRDHLDSIQESVFRCRDITHKLLGFVRHNDIELHAHNIHQLLDNVVGGLLGHEMELANIEILRDYADDIPALVTDSNQLQQVFINLFKNAEDAIEGKPGKIRIGTARRGEQLVITVADTGKGMTSDQLNKIFLPFFTTKEVGKGTGLGLSVSYGIIKSLGGKIEVDSSPGAGSTFTITLPLK
ncbi:MAG: ATP-binding protein, partial [bacterium]